MVKLTGIAVTFNYRGMTLWPCTLVHCPGDVNTGRAADKISTTKDAKVHEGKPCSPVSSLASQTANGNCCGQAAQGVESRGFEEGTCSRHAVMELRGRLLPQALSSRCWRWLRFQ